METACTHQDGCMCYHDTMHRFISGLFIFPRDARVYETDETAALIDDVLDGFAGSAKPRVPTGYVAAN